MNGSLENRKPNYHVSGTCEHCINSPNDPTPPILMEILFENQVVNLPIKFSAVGDGLELVALAGVTTGYCYNCEMKSIDSKVSRGLNFSRQRIPLNGDDIIVRQIAKRTSDEAIINSRNFQHSQTINITQRRADNFNYKRKPVYQFANSVEEAQDPEFHTEINIITKRMYNRGSEYCKLQDAHLLENNVAQPNQEEALNNYLKILPAVKTLSQNLKTEANIILNQIKKFKTSSLEATEKKNQFKRGDSSQAAKKARASKKRAVEKLAKSKKKLSILNSKFENSNLS